MKKLLTITLILIIISGGAIANETMNRNIFKEGILEGYFIEYKENNIMVEEYEGTVYSIPMAKDIKLEIDGRPVKITDFKRGMEIYAELEGRNIKYMDAYSVANMAYIQEGEKKRIGTIKEIDRDQLIIKLPTGEEETYFISPITIIQKNNQNTTANQLYIGDRVKLYFDDIDSSYISRLEIEGDSIIVKDLYRGKIAIVDNLEDVIALEKIEVFENGSWKAKDMVNLKLPYNQDNPIYMGGQEISQKNLKHYKGKTVYMVIKDYFGKEKIEKMVVKSQNERSFTEKITAISQYGAQLELGNNKNIHYNDGTIIIKSNRLVESYNLNPQSDGLIIADGRGEDLSADVIYIYNEDINNSNIGQDHIYSGRLNTINPDNVYLKDFFLLEKNDWESFPEEKELFYDDDSYIYDMENGKEISPKEFYSKNFSVDESTNKDDKSRDWYGYIYTDGDRIVAAYIKKSIDSLLLQRTSIGIVENNPTESETMGWTTTIKNVKNWSTRNEEWMAANAALNIYFREAMIIKNGQRIGVEHIKAGDNLYLIRENNMAKVVIVK